jgi:hypothetical protein
VRLPTRSLSTRRAFLEHDPSLVELSLHLPHLLQRGRNLHRPVELDVLAAEGDDNRRRQRL